MAANKKIPAIRFKGFEEGWEDKKLGEIFDWNIPTNTLSRANLNDNKGEIKNIHYGDILIKYNSCLNISENNIPYITNGNIVDFKQHFLKDGDIIFADAAEDEMVGKSIEICNVSNNYVVAGLHTIVARPLIKFKKYYLGYYLNSNSFHGQLISLMQGTKVLSISKNNLKKTSLNYPHPSEQNQLGNYFKELDNLIQLQEQKLEKVTNLKKAMLEKMFPAANADVPEIRFKGFTEKWEKKKLGDVMALENGYAFQSKFFREEKSDFIVLTPGNVNIGGGFQDGKGRYYDIKGKYPTKYLLHPGDIFITMTDLTPTAQTLGLPAFVPMDKNFYLHNQRLGKLVNYVGDINFLFQLLCTEKSHIQIVSTASGTTVKHSSLKKIMDCIHHFPSIQEQQKIGKYFQNLDQLINQSQQKITQLKHLKQALLQKMFI